MDMEKGGEKERRKRGGVGKGEGARTRREGQEVDEERRRGSTRVAIIGNGLQDESEEPLVQEGQYEACDLTSRVADHIGRTILLLISCSLLLPSE